MLGLRDFALDEMDADPKPLAPNDMAFALSYVGLDNEIEVVRKKWRLQKFQQGSIFRQVADQALYRANRKGNAAGFEGPLARKLTPLIHKRSNLK